MNSIYIRKIYLALLLFSLLITGCSETKYLLKYEQPSVKRIWPSPPDIPRYKYVGQLTGEDNLEAIKEGGTGETITNFFRALVGLGSETENLRLLQSPKAGVVDQSGRILVTDAGRQAIFVFDEKLGKLDIWKQAHEDYNFVSPVGVAIAKNGDVLVTDTELKRVVRLDAKTGNPKGEFGFEDLERPTGLAVDLGSGRIFVADTNEHNIKVFDEDGKLVQIIGQVGKKPGEFNAPTDLAFIDNKLYVVDTFNARVQAFDNQGKFLNFIGKRGRYLGNLVRPKGVTADSDGNVYIVESFHDYLLIYNQNAQFLLPIGGTGAGIGEFYLPAGVWTDHRDRIYVADMFNGRVSIFQYLQGKGRSGSSESQMLKKGAGQPTKAVEKKQ